MNREGLASALVLLGHFQEERAARNAIDAVFDAIIREVAAGESVLITGVGTFEKAQRAPRTGRNPRNGESVRIPPTAVPKFRPGSAFKSYVADPKKLPNDRPASVREPMRAEVWPSKVPPPIVPEREKPDPLDVGGRWVKDARGVRRWEPVSA